MSVHAGEILHLGSQTVIDRIQSAGLGDVRLPMETIREVGNREVVDKVPGEPDFTFTMESLDVSTDLMAFLTGRPVTGSGSATAPGATDPAHTSYDWLDCRFINIVSPWKNPSTGSAGTIEAGHLVPGYYPKRLRYRFGVTDNSTQEVELGGGSFFYAEYAPYEQIGSGNGVQTAFASTYPAIQYRRGGLGGTTFRSVFGVIVNGQLQTEGVDYTVSGGSAGPTGSTATITFTTAPANGVDVRFCYFTSQSFAFPQTVHASTVVKPAAVRGRNIRVLVNGSRVGGIQSAELEATTEGEVERELGSEDIVGFSVTGTDTNGSFTVRSKDRDAFFDLLQAVTGVARNEVYGWFNDNTVTLQIQIEDPRNPGSIIKTIYVHDAKFQPPGTPARVNTPTDFAVNWESTSGTFQEYKGTIS